MDSDPLFTPRSSLPPSSAAIVEPTPAENTRTTPSRPRRVADALALGDEDGAGAGNDEADAGGRKRRKPRGQLSGDVPLVRDAVGESVAESFGTFLKT